MSDLDPAREAVRVLEDGGWKLTGEDVDLIGAVLTASGLMEQVETLRADMQLALRTATFESNGLREQVERLARERDEARQVCQMAHDAAVNHEEDARQAEARALAAEEERDNCENWAEHLHDTLELAHLRGEFDPAIDDLIRRVLADADRARRSSTVNEEGPDA